MATATTQTTGWSAARSDLGNSCAKRKTRPVPTVRSLNLPGPAQTGVHSFAHNVQEYTGNNRDWILL